MTKLEELLQGIISGAEPPIAYFEAGLFIDACSVEAMSDAIGDDVQRSIKMSDVMDYADSWKDARYGLPPADKSVLVFADGQKLIASQRDGYFNDANGQLLMVTHWQELPDDPRHPQQPIE